MVFEAVLISVTLLALLIASYTDFRTREVPDWLSYGLIFAALGIRGVFSVEFGWSLLLSGIVGLLICLALSTLFYYTRQWGGGDSKMLMAMGAVIGVHFPFSAESVKLLLFFLGLLFVGAVYGLLWMSVIALKRWEEFLPVFREHLHEYAGWHIFTAVLSLGLLIFSYVYGWLWAFVPIPLGLFYVFSFVAVIEDKFFVFRRPVRSLTEGDWLAQDVRQKGRLILGARTLERKDLRTLAARHVGNVSVREGVPFIPIFLLTYLAMVLGVWGWVVRVVMG